MKKVTLYVRPDASVEFLNSPGAPLPPVGFLGGAEEIRRLSDVEPDWLPLRLLFRLVRRLFGDKGWAAEWTRNWRCRWRVDLGRVGGPLLRFDPMTWLPFPDRAAAIAAEVAWLEKNYFSKSGVV